MELSRMPFTHRWYCDTASQLVEIGLLSLGFPFLLPYLSMIYEFILYLYSLHYRYGFSKVTGLLKFDEAFRRPYLEYVLPVNSPNREANASPIG